MPFYQNAHAFLEAVILRYRSIAHYSDIGLKRSFHKRRQHIVHFETAYRQPHFFRFAFFNTHPYPPLRHLRIHTVIGKDGQASYFHTKSYDGRESLENEPSLNIAVAGATGISRGSAYTIAALLFEEIEGLYLPALHRLRFRRIREIDGITCIAVSGLHPYDGRRVTAWFGAKDLMLRRVLENTSYGKSEELRFNIKTDHIIPENIFRAPTISN